MPRRDVNLSEFDLTSMIQAGFLQLGVEEAELIDGAYAKFCPVWRVAMEIWGQGTGTDYFAAENNHAIILIRQGSCEVTTASGPVRCGPGTAILCPGGQRRRIWVDGGEHMQVTAVSFGSGNDLLPDSSRLIGGNRPVLLNRPAEVEDLTRRMLYYLRQRTELGAQICRHLLCVLLLLLDEATRLPRASGTVSETLAGRCRVYMEDHFHGLRSFQEVARQLGHSPDYLARVFRRHIGESPGLFLRRLKLHRASFWLHYTNMPVGRIAESLSYSDAFTFSKAFRRSYGIAPTQWREQSRRMDPGGDWFSFDETSL